MRKLLGLLGIALTVGSLAGFISTSAMLVLGGLELPLAHAVVLLGTLFGGAAGGAALAIAGSGGGQQVFEREQKLLRLASARRGQLTVAEVAADCQLSVAESKFALEEMCVQGVAEVQITDSGEIVYEFAGLKRAAGPATEALPATPEAQRLSAHEPEVLEAEIVRPVPTARPGLPTTAPVIRTGFSPDAPYGISPFTGRPYSPRRKTVAGVLQIVPALMGIGGIGRIYTGHFFRGLAQLILGPMGIGILWSVLDGLYMLATQRGTDSEGRPLRPERPRLPPHGPV